MEEMGGRVGDMVGGCTVYSGCLYRVGWWGVVDSSR